MRLASSQSEEQDFVLVEMDFSADHSLDPVVIDREGVPKNVGLSVVVGSPQVDEGALGGRLQVQPPAFGDGRAGRCGLDACGMALPRGGDVALGAGLQGGGAAMLETRPDLGLPEAVKVFDGRLEAGLVRNGEDRDNAQAQAQADHTADRVRVLPRSREAVVVVELGVARPADLAPMLLQGLDDEGGADPAFRPDRRQTAMQGNPRENRQLRPTADGQAFDGVEAVQFAVSVGDRGEIPTGGRRGTADAWAAIQHAMSGENATDGANRGERWGGLGPELSMDGRGSVLSQSAAILETLAGGQDASFQGGLGTSRLAWGGTAVVPIDAVQTLALSPLHPMLDGGQRNRVAIGDRSHGTASSNFSHHLGAILGRQVFWTSEPPCGFLLIDTRRALGPSPPDPAPRGGGGRNSGRATPPLRSARPPDKSYFSPQTDLKVL